MADSDQTYRDPFGKFLSGARVMRVAVTTDGSGDATFYLPAAFGYLHSIRYINTSFTGTINVTITNNTTGQGIWTQTNIGTSNLIKFPRFIANDLAGAALSALAVAERVFLANEKIKIVVAGAGATKVADFEAVVLPY